MKVNEMQVNQPQSPIHTEQTTKVVATTQPKQSEQTQITSPVSNPEAFKKTTTGATTINLEHDSELINQAVENSDTASIVEQSENLPTPSNLLTAIQNVELKAVTTVEKTGLASAQQEYRDHKHDLQVLSKTEVSHNPNIQRVTGNVDYSPLMSEGIQTDLQYFSTGLQAGQRDGQIESQLKEAFAPALHNLDKASRTVFNAKTNIAKVNQETQQMAQNWIEGLGSDSDMAIILKSKSHDELRVLVKEMVGDIKDYDQTDLDQLSKKKNQFIDAIVTGIEKGFQSAPPSAHPGQLAQRLQGMQTKLAQILEQNPELREDLTLRTNPQIKQKLGQVMGLSNPQVIDALYKGALQSIQNDVSAGTVTKNGIEVPATFQLNGQTYGEPKYLDKGGFANVFRYKNFETGEFVAVKISNIQEGKDPEELRTEELNEISTHKEILGTNGNPNIIGLKGVLKTQSDQLIMVQEFADGGNLRGFMNQLNTLEETGIISHEQRLLLATSILKGVLNGARHMENQNTFHFDLKLDNCLLGSDFEPKITDFGMSGLGSHKQMNAKTETADNPLFKSPERLENEHRMVREAKDTINQYIRENHGFFDPGAEPRPPSKHKINQKPTKTDSPEQMAQYKLDLAQDEQDVAKYKLDLKQYKIDHTQFLENQTEYNSLFEHYNNQGMGSQTLSAKSDNWAMGVLAVELLTGNSKSVDVFNHKFNTKMEKALLDFGKGQGSVLSTENSELGETPTVRFINALLKPQAGERVSFEGALESSVMQDPRLDSPALKEILAFFKQTALPKFPRLATEEAAYNIAMDQWKVQHQEALTQLFEQI
jgi:serine/threonine protein kinase